ncbi:hypothetical protein BGZ65_005180 [Modicella reniformis]|uniref:Uncharacterized protein n=1 Tax=Modicella reniformis TaxID=1440133 RepID=A0A9P6MGN1_9FUNG|nr:hypothetical protein BGZ65_005180 [Modicella reniformis]
MNYLGALNNNTGLIFKYEKYDNALQGLGLSLCTEFHTQIATISVGNMKVDTTRNWSVGLSLAPNGTAMSGFGSTAYIYITPSQGNQFVQNGGRLPVGTPFPYDYYPNLYILTQGASSVKINVNSQATQVIRKDFFGLFGLYQKDMKYDITTTANTFTEEYSKVSTINVVLNKYFLEQTEIPVTSVQDAIASLGGAFSVGWGVFYFFFGVGRLNPFGMISKRFVRTKIQNSLTAADGYSASQSVTIESQEKAPNSVLANAPSNSPSDMCGEHHVVFDKKLQQLDQHLQNVGKDYARLEGLLREYYLEMDIAKVDTPTTGDSRRWPRWTWPFRSRNSQSS